MSLGLLFPGQGTQHPDMLPWLGESDPSPCALRKMRERLGPDWRENMRDPNWAMDNANAQILLTGACLAAWEQLRPLLPRPKAVAGYSVGELPALCVAGVVGTAEAFQLAHRRAAIMDACVHGLPRSGLLAVAGIDEAQLLPLMELHDLYPAIRLGVRSVIVGGTVHQLSAVEHQIVALGGTAKHLAVSLASHTPLMSPGVKPLAAVLDLIPFSAPTATPIFNRTGQPAFQPTQMRQAISSQIANTVHWDTCMDSLQEQGVTCVLEVGPGSTLSRLWNERFAHIPARSADEFRYAQGVASWVSSRLQR